MLQDALLPFVKFLVRREESPQITLKQCECPYQQYKVYMNTLGPILRNAISHSSELYEWVLLLREVATPMLRHNDQVGDQGLPLELTLRTMKPKSVKALIDACDVTKDDERRLLTRVFVDLGPAYRRRVRQPCSTCADCSCGFVDMFGFVN
jgi:hypothetical protein